MPPSLLIIIVLIAAWLLFELGWLSRPAPWEKATGWNAIAPKFRPGCTTFFAKDGPEAIWLGHAGFIIRWHGKTLLLDPNRSGHCTVARRAMRIPPSIADLSCDAILITHAHFDHLNLDTLAELKSRSRFIVPAGAEEYFSDAHCGAHELSAVNAWNSVRVGPLTITAVPAAHNGGRYHPWKSRKAAVGYAIGDGTTTLYCAGDTSAANDFNAIRERFQPRFAILPIGAFRPRRPLRDHHMNPEEAVAAARTLGVKAVMPCHFGTFRLSLDRVTTALPRFASAARMAGLRWIMPSLWKGEHAG